MADDRHATPHTDVRSVYLTFPDLEAATRVGRALLEARLVACVNVLPVARSLFWWEGEIQEESEVVALAKTRAELVPAVAERVRQLHPYDTPCVVAFPVADGDAGYLAWVRSATGG